MYIQCSTDSYDFKYLSPVTLFIKLSIVITFLMFSSYCHIQFYSKAVETKPFPALSLQNEFKKLRYIIKH